MGDVSGELMSRRVDRQNRRGIVGVAIGAKRTPIWDSDPDERVMSLERAMERARSDFQRARHASDRQPLLPERQGAGQVHRDGRTTDLFARLPRPFHSRARASHDLEALLLGYPRKYGNQQRSHGTTKIEPRLADAHDRNVDSIQVEDGGEVANH